MSDSETRAGYALGLRAGDWVEVRSAEEILTTLDERGCLDALPFMPEMLQYCGRKFRVYKSAHKTCDTLKNWRIIRHMSNAVHLEGIRCDGSAHNGCQALCLIFWKEAWLKPSSPESKGDQTETISKGPSATGNGGARCDLAALTRATRVPSSEREVNEERYSCQATQHVMATTGMWWWDPRHYIKDLLSRNVELRIFLRTLIIAAFNGVMRWLRVGRPYPYVRGLAVKQTPTLTLNLQVGELVQIRSRDEIMPTIDRDRKNRGMIFDEEMVPYCGGTYRVLRRVERIIDEKTGKMMNFLNPCIILDGVICSGCYSRFRLFCPRSIYSYWREIWLKRLD